MHNKGLSSQTLLISIFLLIGFATIHFFNISVLLETKLLSSRNLHQFYFYYLYFYSHVVCPIERELPLGMESRVIPDDNIIASSVFSGLYIASLARLNYPGTIPKCFNTMITKARNVPLQCKV